MTAAYHELFETELNRIALVSYSLEIKMRFKAGLFAFSVFCQDVEWTEIENTSFKASTQIGAEYSTLEEAKTNCAENAQCAGITKYKIGKSDETPYRLLAGPNIKDVQPDFQPATTYLKSFRHIWSGKHTRTLLAGHTSYGSDAFSDLEQAKIQCLVLVQKGNACGGITENPSGGFELRVGPELRQTSTEEHSYVWYRYTSLDEYEIDITFEK